jgi:predicted TIM-barrel fold metal-dependent hydrolase
LPAVRTLLEAGTSGIVFAHLGYPAVEDGRLVSGRELLEFADAPDVYTTLSGQSESLEFPYAPFDDFTRETIDAFGAERVIWASNYPVCGDVEAAKRDLALITDGGWGLGPEQIELITHVNAERLWFS